MNIMFVSPNLDNIIVIQDIKKDNSLFFPYKPLTLPLFYWLRSKLRKAKNNVGKINKYTGKKLTAQTFNELKKKWREIYNYAIATFGSELVEWDGDRTTSCIIDFIQKGKAQSEEQEGQKGEIKGEGEVISIFDSLPRMTNQLFGRFEKILPLVSDNEDKINACEDSTACKPATCEDSTICELFIYHFTEQTKKLFPEYCELSDVIHLLTSYQLFIGFANILYRQSYFTAFYRKLCLSIFDRFNEMYNELSL